MHGNMNVKQTYDFISSVLGDDVCSSLFLLLTSIRNVFSVLLADLPWRTRSSWCS